MNINREQASSALQDIARAQRRLGVFSGYQRAAPHLWMWGLIWIVGYGTTDLAPQFAGWTWLVLNLGGILVGYMIMQRQSVAAGQASAVGEGQWIPQRMVGVALGIVIFIFATFDLLRPQTLVQYSAFPVLLMGLLYSLFGIWAGSRWLVTGLTLSAVSLFGYHFVEQHALLWLGACGGATLILSGFWMRAR
jgi:hypothetical protein